LGIAQGWHPDDLTYLANLPVDTFYGIFKAAPAERRQQMINAALQFDRTAGSTENMKAISRKAKEALLRIGGESRINALRVARYGIVVEGAATHAPPVCS